MKCPRCDQHKAETVAKSPIEGAWEVYQCNLCFFTWRSCEPESIVNGEKYKKSFKVNPADVPLATKVPEVPSRLEE